MSDRKINFKSPEREPMSRNVSECHTFKDSIFAPAKSSSRNALRDEPLRNFRRTMASRAAESVTFSRTSIFHFCSTTPTPFQITPV